MISRGPQRPDITDFQTDRFQEVVDMKAVRDLFGCISSSTAATDVSLQDTAGDKPRGTPARRNAPGTPLERLQALKRVKQKALCSDLNAQYAAAGQLLKRAHKLSLPLKAGSSEEKTLKGFQQDILSVQGDIADRLHGKSQGPHIPRHEARERLKEAEEALNKFGQ
ncbi:MULTISPECIES: hypothetical protein [Ralstonia solanacearum species complex]|uniref:hypothetical protein n=1 Tax=Ralstonia solanacearum species complex TaxID=3116862 RepID=UPI001F0983CA|nr:hypothetical protein [Ralstonia solanacearum]